MPSSSAQILSHDEGPAAEVFTPDGTGPVVLACEHASARIPAALEGLGLSAEDRLSHAAWDPGALELAMLMSDMLQAPLVAARFSRLVYDCNRPPAAPTAMPPQSERIEVPGNHDLDAAQRAARVTEIYQPFRDALAAVMHRHGGALVTIHSFTPSWFGTPRNTELGLLHDSDARLAQAMIREWRGPLKAELNAPYSAADGVTHTLQVHALPRQRANVMIEVRNDLLASPDAVRAVAEQLCGALSRSLAQMATDPACGGGEGQHT